ncbi:Leukocyte immunoglobulin-like receptor subfamily A member 6 [Cricetulus griseus]|nr:Leukocyte immunoglobulin-like receptor subfamily A member 6 [Cricetulus griseus]
MEVFSKFLKYKSVTLDVQPSDTKDNIKTETQDKEDIHTFQQWLPVVTEGGKVTLQCGSMQLYHRFVLIKEGPQKQSWTLDSEYYYFTWPFRAKFHVGPVTSSQRWTFRCYSFHSNRPLVWSEPSDPLELLFSGTLHKPTIQAEPGTMVTSGNSMNISCQGTLEAEVYFLYKKGSKQTWGTQTPKKPGKKSTFSIPSVTQSHAGQYRCYCYTSAGWSEPRDTLELVVTGIYDTKPHLAELPSPVVTSGENMTLQCVSQESYDKFILTKEDQKFSSSLTSQYINSTMQYQALFSIDHVTADHTGTFQCYGYYNQTPQLWSAPIEALEMHISGLSKKPSLLTHQGHILDPGKSLTLHCGSDINYDRFALYKLGKTKFTQHYGQRTQAGLSLANFTLGYVSSSTAGQYRCCGAHNLSSEWSASSDPLDIMITGYGQAGRYKCGYQIPGGKSVFSEFLELVVTGAYIKPSLSAQPSPVVTEGGNVILQCVSKQGYYKLTLTKEGQQKYFWTPDSVYHNSTGHYQARFSVGPVTSSQRLIFRCYSFGSFSTLVWSSSCSQVRNTSFP